MMKRHFGVVGYVAFVSALGLVGGSVAAPARAAGHGYCEHNGCVTYVTFDYCADGFPDQNCYMEGEDCFQVDCEYFPEGR